MAAAAVQWPVTQFMAQAQAIKVQLDNATVALSHDAARLGSMYEAARQRMDPARDAFIAPAIHSNTVLRVQYLKPARAKYVQAVNAAAGALRSAGLEAPNLTGLGVAPAVIVPAAAVAVLVLCGTAAYVVSRLTQAQIANTDTIAGIMSNPNMTLADKLKSVQAVNANMEAQRRANPPLFDPGSFALPLGLLALIVLGPNLMRMLPQRRGAAA